MGTHKTNINDANIIVNLDNLLKREYIPSCSLTSLVVGLGPGAQAPLNKRLNGLRIKWVEKIKLLELLLGNRETIIRGYISGITSTIIFVLLTGIYFLIHPGAEQLKELTQRVMPISGGDTVFVYAFCILGYVFVGMILAGSQLIGWLFIRPIASGLAEIWPDSDNPFLPWLIGSITVWSAIALAISQPLWYSAERVDLLSLLSIILIAIISGAVGGIATGKTTLGFSGDERQRWVLGGVVSSGVYLFLMQLPPIFTAIQTLDYPALSEIVLGFCLSSGVAGIVGMILYAFPIWPIASLLTRLRFLKDHTILIWVIVSMLVWAGLAGLFVSFTPEQIPILAKVSLIALGGISGTCGGWVVGQLKHS